MKLYLRLIDLSMDNQNPNNEMYIETYSNYDIVGQIQAFAKRNCTDLDHIRTFVYEKRKDFEEARRQWVATVDWSRVL